MNMQKLAPKRVLSNLKTLSNSLGNLQSVTWQLTLLMVEKTNWKWQNYLVWKSHDHRQLLAMKHLIRN